MQWLVLLRATRSQKDFTSYANLRFRRKEVCSCENFRIFSFVKYQGTLRNTFWSELWSGLWKIRSSLFTIFGNFGKLLKFKFVAPIVTSFFHHLLRNLLRSCSALFSTWLRPWDKRSENEIYENLVNSNDGSDISKIHPPR